MATTVQVQPPPSRPSMDRTPSLDQPISRSTTPFAHPHFDRAPSPNIRPPHSRTSSNASASSPYSQPLNALANAYFPASAGQMYGIGIQPTQTAWANTALPANAFYQPHMPSYPGQVFQRGFQQSQADFAAWATAYHHMVAASMANGNNQGMVPPQPEYMEGGRRRTNSGPSSTGSNGNTVAYSQSYHDFNQHIQQNSQKTQQPIQPQTYHPYKRGPSDRPSRENIAASASIPRSVSQPVFPDSKISQHSPSNSVNSTPQDQHRRSSSLESSASRTSSVVPPPRVASRQEAYAYDRENANPSPAPSSATVRAATPALTAKATPATQTATIRAVSQPLHTGPIANATNTPRPSPLSQAPTTATAEPEKAKSGGLKGKLRRVLDKDATTPKKQDPAPKHQFTTRPTFPSPSDTSTRSATPPTTPPQASDFRPPSAPFGVQNPMAMDSEVSLAETERTTTAPSEMTGTGKSKRSLFRMKNMSTDNISLASTVSSASMMLRKMGSLGKIARRNSLMSISKIFKDKPKDEDGPLPEKEGKIKKKSKKDKNKSDAAPAAVSHATAEIDRDPTLRLSDDENRTLAGLSPAAKLARQHTLRSRAEQAKNNAQQKTGVPTWDNNTTTRQANGQLPSISSVAGQAGLVQGPEVVHITPGRTSTVVHAVAVSENEYDSEDDSSDGETVEDVTVQMGRARLSDGWSDEEFRQLWGASFIDRNAVPKKSILKNAISLEHLERNGWRQRSSSTAEVPQLSSQSSPLSHSLADANQIDGIYHPTPQSHSPSETTDPQYDPFSPSFSPFESPAQTPDLHSPYSNHSMNTSAPTLSLAHPSKPLTPRSMTVPARKQINWSTECAVFSTYDSLTYDRKGLSGPYGSITPEDAMRIKQELNAVKMEMPVHPSSRVYTHWFPS